MGDLGRKLETSSFGRYLEVGRAVGGVLSWRHHVVVLLPRIVEKERLSTGEALVRAYARMAVFV